MVGIVNPQRPVELLDAIIGYLLKHGVSDLSLRPLAKAVSSSPRVLLYHFGSKERMIDRVLAHIREQQRARYEQMSPPTFTPPSAGCREIWSSMTAPDSEALFRLFFEIYSLALQRPRRFADFLHNTVHDWINFVADPMCREEYGREDSRAFATVVLAGFRGFMLDYCATHDRKRLNRALDFWLAGLDAAPLSRAKRIPLRRPKPKTLPRSERLSRRSS
jgi:AcrR family transcriptional regulator